MSTDPTEGSQDQEPQSGGGIASGGSASAVAEYKDVPTQINLHLHDLKDQIKLAFDSLNSWPDAYAEFLRAVPDHDEAAYFAKALKSDNKELIYGCLVRALKRQWQLRLQRHNLAVLDEIQQSDISASGQGRDQLSKQDNGTSDAEETDVERPKTPTQRGQLKDRPSPDEELWITIALKILAENPGLVTLDDRGLLPLIGEDHDYNALQIAAQCACPQLVEELLVAVKSNRTDQEFEHAVEFRDSREGKTALAYAIEKLDSRAWKSFFNITPGWHSSGTRDRMIILFMPWFAPPECRVVRGV
jgi:hypothetical protein